MDDRAGGVVINDRPDRNFQRNALAFFAGAVGTFTVASALRFVFGIEAEVHQRVVALAGFPVDVAALAAIATGRSAARNIFLAPEGNAAVPAVAGFNTDFGLVDEHSQLSAVSSQLSVLAALRLNFGLTESR